jgi:hypothetical protein
MVTYPGSFAGRLVRRPEVEYFAEQSVMISAEQNNQVLNRVCITNIGLAGVEFSLEFNYHSINDSVCLVIQTHVQDDQFNKDNPVVVESLILDNLFTIPHLLHSGVLTNNGVVIDTGNVLWCPGKLVYIFKLPIISIAGIAE